MAKKQRDMAGVLSENQYPRKGDEGKNDPQFQGRVTIKNVEYWIKAWVNEGGDGKKWFSIKFNDMEAKYHGVPEEQSVHKSTAKSDGVSDPI